MIEPEDFKFFSETEYQPILHTSARGMEDYLHDEGSHEKSSTGQGRHEVKIVSIPVRKWIVRKNDF